MSRRFPSLIWLVSMYTITGLSEAGPPLNLVETQRIIIHLSGYLLLALLMAYAYPDRSRRTWLALLTLALVTGIGQEVLQNLARDRVYLGPSLFDLAVDTAGASLGLLGYHRVMNRRQ